MCFVVVVSEQFPVNTRQLSSIEIATELFTDPVNKKSNKEIFPSTENLFFKN